LLCLILFVGGVYWWFSQAFGALLTYQGPSGNLSVSEHAGDADIVEILRKVKLTKSNGVASLDYSPQAGDKYSFTYLSKSTAITKSYRRVTIPASGASSHVELSIQQETGVSDIDAINIGLMRDGKYGSLVVPCK